MDTASEQRVQAIRHRVQEERAALAKLNARLGDLKDLLKPCQSLLDFVLHGFLDGKILAEDRAPAALNRWLDQAELMLGEAEKQREYVEGLERKYGANARVIGG